MIHILIFHAPLLFEAMAKSVYQKKKRIAHFQNPIENFTEGECIFDYVSSIIQNMDDSFNSVHSSSKELAKTKLINSNGQRDSLGNAPSTSNDSQNEKKSKSNKFSVSRKYPLMEKTQKILKQLKLNRRIPKPRAHVSSLSKSPLKKVDYKVCNVQKMKQQKGGRKLKINTSFYNAHVSDDSILKTSHMDSDSKISNCKISEVQKHGKAENTAFENSSAHCSRNDLCNSNRKTSVNINVERNSLCNADTVKDSENDTTDSEYERFVKRNKKGLQKKVLKKQKHSIAKRKTSKKKSTKISESTVKRENIPKQYDSDDSDSDMLASLSSNCKKASPFKKLRVISDMPTEVKTRNVLNEESEPEMFADDVCTRDSSLESDIADNESSITNRTKPPSEKNVCPVLHETNSLGDSSSKSDTTLPDIGSFINKDNVSETSYLIVNNIVPNNGSPFSSCINPSDSDKTKPDDIVPNSDSLFSSRMNISNSDRTEPNNLPPNLLVIDLCDSDDECKNVMVDGLSTVSIPKKEKCVVTNVTIDLCDSDNDDKNASTCEPSNVFGPKEEKCVINVPQHVNHPDCDEFDLEILEITPAHSRKSHCVISKASSVYDKGACQAIKTNIKNNIGNKHMQTVIKTEVSGNVHITGASDVENQNKKNDDGKYDAVYMTNICSDFKKDELVLPESTCSASSVHDKKIKTEMPEIFIDSVKGVSYSSNNILKMDMHHNYQHQKCSDLPINFYGESTTVKDECSLENLSSLEKKYSVDCVSSRSKDTPFSENILKSFDICSNPKKLYSGACDGKQKFQELEQMNISHLLELFKKEFQTYQEIIQTEANVEASLKVLETHQAEKLKYIRSLVQKHVGSNQDLSKISHRSMKEQEHKSSMLPKNEALSTFETLSADKTSMFTLIDLSNDTESSTYQNVEGNRFSEVPCGSLFPQTAVLTSKVDNDIKPDICRLDELQSVQQLPHSEAVRSKHEAELSPLNLIVYSSKFQSGGKQTLKLLKEKCNVCGKEAMAACQRCAKVFFCSHDCGKLFWINGHENECGK